MKKLLAALMLITAAAPMCVRAEGPDGPGAPGEHRRYTVDDRVAQMTKHLDLTADQQAKVKAILEDSRVKMDAVGAQMKALREKTDAEVKAVLTPSQQTKLEEIKQRHRERRAEKRNEKK